MDACRGEELEGLTGPDGAFFVSARYEEGFLNSGGGELTLALSRKRKEELVQQYAERMAGAQVAIWSRFEGISVEEFDDLRQAIRETGADTMVVKNNLVEIALEQSGLPSDDMMMGGPRLVTFIYDDIAPAAKALSDFAGDQGDLFEVLGGIVEGELADAGQMEALTELPSREQLLAQVLAGMQAPVTGLVAVLSGMMRNMLYVLQARSRQLQEAE